MAATGTIATSPPAADRLSRVGARGARIVLRGERSDRPSHELEWLTEPLAPTP